MNYLLSIYDNNFNLKQNLLKSFNNTILNNRLFMSLTYFNLYFFIFLIIVRLIYENTQDLKIMFRLNNPH